MGDRSPQLFGGDRFVGDGFNHVGAGHEHVGAVLDHEDEVGHGRRIDRAAGTGPHDHGHLGNDAGSHDVALEHVGVAAQRIHPFLDARTAGIVEPDDRGAHLHGLIHDLADLLGMGFGQGAAIDGEILTEHEHQATVEGPVAGDDAVAGHLLLLHAEVGAAVLDEHVPLFEGVRVQKQLDALAGGQFALGMLSLYTLDTAPEAGFLALFFQLLNDLVHSAFPIILSVVFRRWSSC